MNKTDKKNARIGKALIYVIIGLFAIALGFKLYDAEDSEQVELFPEGLEDQISLELRNNQTQVSDVVELTGAEAAEGLEKIYFIRVNHDEDIAVDFEVNLLSATGDIDGALRVKVYDDTNEQDIYDGSLEELMSDGYELFNEGNASGKTDTRYRITLYLPEETGTMYSDQSAEIEFSWSVPESYQDALETSKSGDVRVILYSFIAMLVIMAFMFIFMRKHMNPEIFRPVKPYSDDEDDEKETSDNSDNEKDKE